MALKNSHICQKWPEKMPSGHPVSEDKFITEDTMAKVLQLIQNLCLQVLFTGGRGSVERAKGK